MLQADIVLDFLLQTDGRVPSFFNSLALDSASAPGLVVRRGGSDVLCS